MAASNLAELCLDLAMHLNDCRHTAEWVKHCQHCKSIQTHPWLRVWVSEVWGVCLWLSLSLSLWVKERERATRRCREKNLRPIFSNHLKWKMYSIKNHFREHWHTLVFCKQQMHWLKWRQSYCYCDVCVTLHLGCSGDLHAQCHYG